MAKVRWKLAFCVYAYWERVSKVTFVGIMKVQNIHPIRQFENDIGIRGENANFGIEEEGLKMPLFGTNHHPHKS